MRYPPLVTAVAGQYRIAGMRVNGPFGRAHDTGLVGEANFHLAFQFSCLDVMGIARDFGGVPNLPAAAKYQLDASFIVLSTARMIHNKSVFADLDRPIRAGIYFVERGVVALIECNGER